MIAVTDEHFILWLALKEKGEKMYCESVHYIKGKLVKDRRGYTKEEGRHQLYDGRDLEETIEILEERARNPISWRLTLEKKSP